MIVVMAFATVLRRPTPDPGSGAMRVSRAALWIWLFLFSLVATAAIAVLALPLILYAGAAPGGPLRAAFGQPVLAVIVTVVVLGPLIEEMIFRGWLTGTRPALAGTAAFLAIVFGGGWLLRQVVPGAAMIGAGVVLAAAGLLAFAAIQRRGGRPAPGWYARAFPFVFWAQGLAFGGLHAANVATASPGLSLLGVVPLVVCGWVWGYARIVLGLGPAWLLHAAYNVPAAAATMVIVALGPT